MRFLPPAELQAIGLRELDDLLGGTEMIVAAGSDDVRGLAAAALLFADYAVLDTHATLHLDAPETWAGAAWRLGHRALRLHIDRRTALPADEAKAEELCDEVIHEDAQQWLDRWMQGRNPVALDSAAALIRRRGGDPLERAAFARLFAMGEPQQGLRAFLARKSNFV
jgi:enoyl-CoA hydratase/carnithine racemase